MGVQDPPSTRHSRSHAEPGRLKVQGKYSRAARVRKTFSGQVYIGIVKITLGVSCTAMRLAILDDYQNVALTMADWDGLRPSAQIQTFHDTLAREEAVAERLRDFEIVVAMRERTAFRRSLLGRLPKLKLLVTTGMVNASIDVKAAPSAALWLAAPVRFGIRRR